MEVSPRGSDPPLWSGPLCSTWCLAFEIIVWTVSATMPKFSFISSKAWARGGSAPAGLISIHGQALLAWPGVRPLKKNSGDCRYWPYLPAYDILSQNMHLHCTRKFVGFLLFFKYRCTVVKARQFLDTDKYFFYVYICMYTYMHILYCMILHLWLHLHTVLPIQ